MVHPRWRTKRRGAATLEMALALLPCMYFVSAILEYGRYEMARQLVIHAARAGARMAVNSKRTAATSDVQAFVIQQLAGQGGAGLSVSIYKADASGNNNGVWTTALVGDPIAVQIQSAYSVMIPSFGILPQTMPLNAKAIVIAEAN